MLQVFVIFCLWTGVVKSEDVDQGWDRLSVRYPQFIAMPMTAHEADTAGWRENGSCEENNVYVGNRYTKDDKMTRLIFGKDGIVAGIQATINPNTRYPSFSGSSPWIKVNDKEAIVTAYFRNPHTICTKPETKAGKTFGKELYIQTKSWLSKEGERMMKIPTDEKDLNEKYPLWIKGKCFQDMGLHYWYNFSENLAYEDIFPVFLLYDNKIRKLKAFGWAIPETVSNQLWEFVPPAYFQFFFNATADIPKCITGQAISSQHIYLSNPKELKCEN